MRNEQEIKKNVPKGLKRFGYEKPAIPGPGRPRLTEEEKNEREILKSSSPAAANLLRIALESKDERNAIRAAEIILSKTVPTLEDSNIHDNRPLHQFSDEQLNAKLREINASAPSNHSGNGASAQ